MKSNETDMHILLVEGDAADTLRMREMIDGWPNQVTLITEKRFSDAIGRAQMQPFDVVLLDLGLPDSRGLATFHRFAEAYPDLPVLVLTGQENAPLGLEAMRAGAADFLIIDNLDQQLLHRAVEHARERHLLKQEMEQVTNELAQREERLKLAMLGAQAVLWDEDVESGSAYFGEGAVKLFGMGAEAIPQTTAAFLKRVHPDDRARVSDAREHHLSINAPVEMDFRLRHETGDYRWVQIRGQPYSRESGEVYRQAGWIIDITDRKQSEEALRIFRSYVDESLDAFEVVDLRTGRFLDVNQQGLEQVGYSREEMLKLHIWDIDPSVHEKEYSELAQQIIERKAIQGESTRRRKDGSTFSVEFRMRLSGDEAAPLGISSVRDISERVARDKELQFQKEIMEETGRIAKVGGWLHDYATQRTYVSEDVARIHEVSAAIPETDQNFWLSLYDPESRAKLVAALKEASTQGTPCNLEIPLTTPSGTHKWIRVIIQPVQEDGQVIRLRGTFQDVTLQHQEEERHVARDRYFRTLIESSSDAIVVSDNHANIRYASKGIEANTGYTPEEYMANDIMAAVHPDDLARVESNFNKLLEEPGCSMPALWRFRHKQGHWIWLEGVVTNLMHDPAIGGLVSNYRNVTERITAANEIAQQARMLDAASDAIIVWDLNRVVRYWNAGAERLYGWRAEEVIGRNMAVEMDELNLESRDAQRVVLETGQWSGLLTQQTASGGTVLVHSSCTLMTDEKGQPESILCIHTDVTEQKDLESKFLRVQRLENIGTIAGGVAHDFNNLLSPILMAVVLLRSDTQDPHKLKMLDILESSAERGKELVSQIMSFSRGVEGKHMLIKPKYIAREVIHLMEVTFPKSITIHSHLPNDIAVVVGDSTQINQVLMNLCVNARDAMPSGGELTITLRNQLVDESYLGERSEISPGHYVVLEVTDTGHGMDDEVRERIFQPFFTTKDPGKGTGLGLATCDGIVKAHHGFMECRSTLGVGTTFRVFLPAHIEKHVEDDSAEDSAIAMGHGETVLVVEDEFSVRKIVEQTLSSFNYKVLSADNGVSGLSTYVAHRGEIAAVLSDVSMPNMNGPTMINAMRAIDPQVKILLSTGNETLSEEVRAAGIDQRYIILKPFVAQTLLNTLRELLDEGDAPAATG